MNRPPLDIDPRRLVPRMDAVLADDRLVEPLLRLGPRLVRQFVTDAIDRCRAGDIAPSEVVDHCLGRLPELATTSRRVINATGIIVHTNLGRAPLSDAAVQAVVQVARATDLEFDLETGKRARRGRGALEALSRTVPAAESVHVVNNGASAIALAVCGLASGKEVVVARGEMVEIGDGFRIPEIIEAAGARLREVGATNRVTFKDYEHAVGPETGFVLKVHPSNFVVDGFVSTVGIEELADLKVPVVHDIGSGLLAPSARLTDEPDATTSLRAGSDIVIASADKLLGGPQAGLLLGRTEHIEVLRRHPMARAFRVDKLTLAALEATLCGPITPVASALEAQPNELKRRAERICESVAALVSAGVEPTSAAVGGGGAPGASLDSVAVTLPASLTDPLRCDQITPVVGRISKGKLLLDLIAVDAADDSRLIEAVRRACEAQSTSCI